MEETPETLAEIIARRNTWLIDYFKRSTLDFNVLIIDINTPMIIFQDKWKVSCYVKNFNLIFLDGENGRERVNEVKLTKDAVPDDNFLRAYVDTYEQRKIYRVKYGLQQLYLSGYNFRVKGDLETKYPVFSRYGYKVYFDIEHATGIVRDFNEMCEEQLVVV